ncbi:MAG: hypothetical protein AAF202_03525 [Pseudomonadota bacterium]
MKVQSLGPFVASSAPDLEHLEVESARLDEKLKATSEVSPDAKSGDSTAEKENRGFIHIIDVIQKEEMKKRKARMRSKDLLYAKGSSQHRVALRYESLDDTDDALESKGSHINKAA